MSCTVTSGFVLVYMSQRVMVGLCDFERSPLKHVSLLPSVSEIQETLKVPYTSFNDIQHFQHLQDKFIISGSCLPISVRVRSHLVACVIGEVRIHSLVRKPLLHYILIEQIVVCCYMNIQNLICRTF